MTITKKESEWAKRITLWFTTGRIVWSVVIAGALFGVKTVESHWLRPYVVQVVKGEYNTLHAPAEKKVCKLEEKIEDAGYQVLLVRNIMEISVGDSVFSLAKKKTDGTYWRRPINH